MKQKDQNIQVGFLEDFPRRELLLSAGSVPLTVINLQSKAEILFTPLKVKLHPDFCIFTAKLSSSGSDSEHEEDQQLRYQQQYQSMESVDISSEMQTQSTGATSYVYDDENAQDYSYTNTQEAEPDEGDNFDPTAFFNSSILQTEAEAGTADIGNDLQVSESESDEDFVAVEGGGGGGGELNQIVEHPYEFL